MAQFASKIAPQKERWASWPNLVILLPFLIVAGLCIDYATRAWFYIDDLGFYRYGNSIALGQLLPSGVTDNFGRFVSRNLSWWINVNFFHGHATWYYLENLAFLLGSTVLIFHILKPRIGRTSALVGAFLYFGTPAVLYSFRWISNSQHIIPEFFFFLFVLIYDRGVRSASLSIGRWLVLVVVFTIGLESNIYFGAVILLPLATFVCVRDSRADRTSLGFTALCLGLLVILAVFIQAAHLPEPYRADLTPTHLLDNVWY